VVTLRLIQQVNSMNLLFFGDPHFDSQTPIVRIDDYADESLIKLSSILDLAIANNVSDVYTTGDFFDKYTVSFSYLNRLVEILRNFKHHKITVWSSIGNHDLPYNSMAYFKSTPLSMLFKSGLVNHIKELNKLPGINIYGIDYTNEKAIDTFDVNNEKVNILVMHYATENTVAGDSIDTKKLEKFDFVISGHDHSYYTPLKLSSGTIVFRPGSLLRRTKEAYNLTRNIMLVLYDTDTNKAKEIKLPGVKPAEAIFKNEVFTEARLDLYSNKYNDLFNKDYFESSANNILDIINELPQTVSEDSKITIIKHLKESGVTV
jgi:DNA repair exonuclease SbcCD nuclease subunit